MVTPADIIRFAAITHGTTPDQIKGTSNDPANRRARFLAAWGLRFYMHMTHRQVSELLGRRGRWAGRYLSGGNSYPKFRQHRREVIRFVRLLSLGLSESPQETASRTDRTCP